MTLGAIAELKVMNPQVLNDLIIHSVPHKMMIERLKIEAGR